MMNPIYKDWKHQILIVFLFFRIIIPQLKLKFKEIWKTLPINVFPHFN